MTLSVYLPALLAAFLITLLEMTEVVILVVAVSAEHPSARTGATGAVAGVGVVSLLAAGVGALLGAFAHLYLLWVSGILLAAFGIFLFRSTLRSYRRAVHPAQGNGPSSEPAGAVQFGTGFTVGSVEAVEAVIVLLAITAAGYGLSALLGALAAGVILVVLALLVHERLRKVKVPWLKLLGTSMLFTFAGFWFGEALGVAWPGSDLFLVPLFILSVLIVRGAVQLGMKPAPSPTP